MCCAGLRQTTGSSPSGSKRLPGQLHRGIYPRRSGEATEEFAGVLENLPEELSDPAIVNEARETIREWVGDIRIEPTTTGPVARWRLTEEGLLMAAGPRVAGLVAGGRVCHVRETYV